MNIVGPLPQSCSGTKYVLVICDYARGYPEAVPLPSADASHVAEELLKFFGDFHKEAILCLVRHT